MADRLLSRGFVHVVEIFSEATNIQPKLHIVEGV